MGRLFGLEQPRLGIGHFMLWTAGAAVWMGLSRLRQELIPNYPGAQTLEQGGIVLVSMILGLALASLPIVISRCLRKIPFPVQPGEWLLVATGVSTLTTQFIWIGVWPFTFEHDWLYSILMGIVYGVNLVVFLFPLFCFRRDRAWRVFFLSIVFADVMRIAWITLSAINYSLAVSMALYYLINEVIVFAQGVALFVALILDRKQPRRRGWFHWTGVVMFFCLLTTNFFRWVYYHLFFG